MMVCQLSGRQNTTDWHKRPPLRDWSLANLWPILFLCFINDLPNCTEIFVKIVFYSGLGRLLLTMLKKNAILPPSCKLE
jgi:hypothetical protein